MNPLLFFSAAFVNILKVRLWLTNGFSCQLLLSPEWKNLGLLGCKDIYSIQVNKRSNQRYDEKCDEGCPIVDHLGKAKYNGDPPDDIIGEINEPVGKVGFRWFLPI